MNVIYCRSAINDSESISKQQQICKELLQSKGLNCDRIYIDNGFSGLSKERPDLKRLTDNIDKIKSITVTGIDRLYRDVELLIQFESMCKSSDVKIYDVNLKKE